MARDTAKHPTMHRAAHPLKELLAPNVNSVKLRNSAIMCQRMVAWIKTVMVRVEEVFSSRYILKVELIVCATGLN